ncbi:hypothetical protein [Stenotrophomonas maltophilia]|uniref:hypothetical protein n=1 Tax=Stenotrophomonas maltophilia TaxID=40324 RepID=UPI001F53AB14|nr:hypothetical protein [Stenotrophomonas maltophilia]
MTGTIADALHQLQRHRGLIRVGEPRTTGASTEIEVDVAVQLPNRSRRNGISETGVRTVETCVLVFGSDWPLSAPEPFLRADFPLNLPHINPHRQGELVSPCLRTFRGTRAARYSVFPSAPSRRATQRFDRSLGSTARPTVEQYAGQAPLECHMQFCQGG